MKTKYHSSLLFICLLFVLTMSCSKDEDTPDVPSSTERYTGDSYGELNSPWVKDEKQQSHQTIWSCIYFGTYPTNEVVRGVLATCDSGLTAYSCRLPSVVRKGMPFLKHILRMPPIATLIHPAVLTPKTMCSSCPAMRCSPRQRLLITDSMPAVGLTTLPAVSAAHSMPSVAVPGGRLWKVIAATLFG